MKTGFVTILGRPNVGKSSLVNALVGSKVSIVSPKPQTTRDRITGVLTEDEYQMSIIDTPGAHAPRNEMSSYMEKCISSAVSGTDVIVVVLSAEDDVRPADIEFIQKQLAIAPVYVVINKTDLAGYDKLYPMLQELSKLTKKHKNYEGVRQIIPVSCKIGYNIDVLKRYLFTHMVDHIEYYSPEQVSDKPVQHTICEIIREKALLLLQDEIPHGIGVMLVGMQEGKISLIDVDIVCEKESHKKIIIGKDGMTLKKIGERARPEIEELLDSKVFLKLFVKVRKDWRNRKSIMKDLGYQ